MGNRRSIIHSRLHRATRLVDPGPPNREKSRSCSLSSSTGRSCKRRWVWSPADTTAGHARFEMFLKKCHSIETNRGGHTMRQRANVQIAASRNVTGRETLQVTSAGASAIGSCTAGRDGCVDGANTTRAKAMSSRIISAIRDRFECRPTRWCRAPYVRSPECRGLRDAVRSCRACAVLRRVHRHRCRGGRSAPADA